MTKPVLISQLQLQYQKLADYLNELPDAQFTFAPTGKWSAGQQLDHLVLSVAPLTKVMQKREVIESFGKAEQPSRDFDGVVTLYQSALARGGKASGQFLPGVIASERRSDLTNKLSIEVNLLCELLDAYSEEDLDQLVIPHPLLGKLTVREMMCFTIYHASHHELGIRKNFK